MNITYCQECAQLLKKLSDTQYRCPNGHDFWNNPRTCVAVVIRKDDKILISKRALEPAKGTYDLPGGFVEFGEDVFAAVIREIQEETGLNLEREALQILTAYTGPYWENESVCDLIIYVKTWQGIPIAADDSEALEWQELSFLESAQFNPPYHGLRDLLETMDSDT